MLKLRNVSFHVIFFLLWRVHCSEYIGCSGQQGERLSKVKERIKALLEVSDKEFDKVTVCYQDSVVYTPVQNTLEHSFTVLLTVSLN